MPSRVMQIGGAAIVVVILLAGLLRWQAASAWSQADFKARALELVAIQLPASARAGLTAKSLPGPSDGSDHFVCVINAQDAYEVQFRRGTFAMSVNQIYTPDWKPPNSGAIARQDCMGAAQP